MTDSNWQPPQPPEVDKEQKPGTGGQMMKGDDQSQVGLSQVRPEVATPTDMGDQSSGVERDRTMDETYPLIGSIDQDGDGMISDEELARQRRIEGLLYQREAAAVEEERSLMKWRSPARPFKERNREYYTTIGAIVVLLSIILIFAREFLLVAVIVSFAFVAYVLASVRPEVVEHEITTRGIRSGGKFFRWSVLGRFWFREKYGQKMVSIETGLNFPGEIMLLVGEIDQERLKDILRVYLLHETPEPKFVDKAAKWLQEKIPLETS